MLFKLRLCHLYYILSVKIITNIFITRNFQAELTTSYVPNEQILSLLSSNNFHHFDMVDISRRNWAFVILFSFVDNMVNWYPHTHAVHWKTNLSVCRARGSDSGSMHYFFLMVWHYLKNIYLFKFDYNRFN